MNKKVLVPIDFSEAATNAAHYAAALSRQLQYDGLVLLHANSPTGKPVFVMDSLDPVVISKGISADALEGLEDLKESILKMEADLNISVIATPEVVGDAVRQILSKADIGLIVTGLGPSESETEYAVGRTLTETFPTLQTPLLVLSASTRFMEIKALVVAFDIKGTWETVASDLLSDLLHRLNARLYVVNVEDDADVSGAEAVIGASRMHQLFDRFSAEFHYLKGEDIPAAIGEFAIKNSAQLIVSSPGKHGFLEKLFNSSVSDELAERSPLPTLFLPGADG